MRIHCLTVLFAIGILMAGLGTIAPAWGQRAPGSRAPRSVDGHPDLSGVWQSLDTANWDLQDHGTYGGPYFQTGSLGAVPSGRGVVEGGDIPYKPAALETKKKNFADRWKLDPEIKCYLPGVPRATYMPYPFQIIQSPASVVMSYQYASANRAVNMGKPVEPSVDTWMGTPNGHWEGETLVVDSKGFNDLSWFDRAGDFHSDALHVIERFTLIDPDHMNYEATVEDAQVFTRPWKIRLPLYRRIEKNAQLTEFKCVEFSEELLYGDLRKKQTGK
jgi:hypothetical protein